MNRNLNSNFPSEVSTKNFGTPLVREYFRSFSLKIGAKKKKIIYFLLGLGTITLSLVSYFLFRVGKNYFSPPKPSEEELSKEIYEEEDNLFPLENPSEELSNASQEQEQIIQYFHQIVTNIRTDNLHGSEIIPWLRGEEERANNTPYLLCSVTNCQWTAPRLHCEHNCYFRCLESDCAFASQENYQYQDYCIFHTCQQCSELVVIYEDNYGEKYCLDCLPNPKF